MKKFTAYISSFALAACGGGGWSNVDAAQPPGIRVKPSSLMTPATGLSSSTITTTAEAPQNPGNEGAFRMSCSPSHMGYDDPIVNQTPGTPNLSHPHVFWGSVTTNYNTDITVSPQTTGGNATCTIGTPNRSRYWAPVMVDTRTGMAITPETIQTYYKTAGNRASAVNPIPIGFRMISGSSIATTSQGFMKPQCQGVGGSGNQYDDYVAAAAGCPAGSTLFVLVDFPDCVSQTLGVPDIDSANHKSHVEYASVGFYGDLTCAAGHPYMIPHISYQIFYIVVDTTKYWRLSSDVYTGPGGFSIHGDFREGWDQAIHKSFVNGCLKIGGDCHSHLLGCRDENDVVVTCRKFGP